MALAFILGAKSPTGNAAIIVENSKLISTGLETHPPVTDEINCLVPAELIALIDKNKEITSATLYLTKPPDHNAALAITACIGIRKVVYYASKPIDSKVLSVLSGSFGEIDEYKGNLNWIYDYIDALDLHANS